MVNHSHIRQSVGTLLCLASCSAFAWNDVGHKAVGAVATRGLTQTARQQVEQILQQLPAPRTDLNSVLPPDPFHELPSDFHVTGTPTIRPLSFQDACTWPDMLRKTKDNPASWLHRGPWHYQDKALIGPGYRGQTPDDGKAAGVIKEMIQIIADTSKPTSTRAMAIAWLGHVVGDVHQPLHATTYFDRSHVFRSGGKTQFGDRGGNDYFLPKSREGEKKPSLHSIWDGALGSKPSDLQAFLTENGIDSSSAAAPEPPINLDNIQTLVQGWLDESYELAKTKIYRVSSTGKPQLSTKASKYRPTSAQKKALAGPRVIEAGKRLASILNAIFGVS